MVRVHRGAVRAVAVALTILTWEHQALAQVPAFPGAVGQGAAATGGRGGDVYHVTNLRDYNRHRGEEKILGSLRHAIEAERSGPRTIVFDVSGAIQLSCPLAINKKHDLTIAGQTSPGGITLWGYPLEISQSSNIVIRYLRVRTGDFNAQRADAEGRPIRPAAGNGNMDLLANSANGVDVGSGSDHVILDHLSVTWGMDEVLTVNMARNVTVQHSMIAESLNRSFHYKGEHGYGTLVRGEVSEDDQQQGTGGYTFYENLWAHNKARNPSIGGQQRLRPGQSEADRGRSDVNLVNNVIYDWGDMPTHRSNIGEVRINIVGNYYVNGPAKRSQYLFKENNSGTTFVFQHGNYHDGDQDDVHDGRLVSAPQDVEKEFRQFDSADMLLGAPDGEPFNFFDLAASSVLPAPQAYDRLVRYVGASLWRDAVDQRLISDLVSRTGFLADSQEQFRDADGRLPGIDDLPNVSRPADFDTDGDGLPNEFETQHGLNPHDPDDGNGTSLSADGYTNLEVYLNSLVE